ncbi:hypothetical protein BGZ65_005100 [Modicella reniformis]|uniref:Uncharacterized protein n=1 Tax=Modicella reniformis TaxID=1440133 RepID=A0A9P6IRY0_9FUNG|nr:hypothetical protein BGZ65_005100 [Modicella reniformis]
MSSVASSALNIPEILQEIAQWIPLFEDDLYAPHNLASCLLVSRLWKTCFTPRLYRYFYVNEDHISHSKNHVLYSKDQLKSSAFQKHNLFVRIILSPSPGPFLRSSPSYEIDIPPSIGGGEGLVVGGGYGNGLGYYSSYFPAGNLSIRSHLHNQYRQWGQLSYLASRRLGAFRQTQYREILSMDLPCLEELELNGFQVSSELLYEIVWRCAGTLRKLNVAQMIEFDERFIKTYGEDCNDDHDTNYTNYTNYTNFNNKDTNITSTISTSSSGNNNTIGDKIKGGQWTLPRLKSLRLELVNKAAEQSLILTRRYEKPCIEQLTSTLREYCPNLHSIGYGSILERTGNYPNPESYALLVKKSFASPRLRCASLSFPRGLEDSMMEALLFHATTLVDLDLRFSVNPLWPGGNRNVANLNMEMICILLSHCDKLKEVRLWGVGCNAHFMDGLFVRPWRCQGLEALVIHGYDSIEIKTNVSRRITSDGSYNDAAKAEEEEYRCLIQDAISRRSRGHEFCDDGQGWFLNPRLAWSKYYDALMNIQWKRRLFEHMYTTSGVKSAKYIRLNDTEFFAEEQV